MQNDVWISEWVPCASICLSAPNCRRRGGVGSFETIGTFRVAVKGLSDLVTFV
jgi:hypothetical protein